MSNVDRDRVLELAGAICNKNASKSDCAELNSLLLNSEEARRDYLNYCRMHAAIRLELRAERAGEKVSLPADVFLPVRDAMPTGDKNNGPRCFAGIGLPVAKNHSLVGYFSSGWPLAYLITSVIFAVAFFVGYHTPTSTRALHTPVVAAPATHSASEASADKPTNTSIAAKTPTFVGRITGEADCRWQLVDSAKSQTKSNQTTKNINQNSPNLPVSGASRLVALGDKLTIAAGFLEITYNTGAKVILEGPCRFDVEQNGGFLAVGRLTGKMEKKGAGARDQGPENSEQRVDAHRKLNARPSSLAPRPSSAPCPLTPDPCPLTPDPFVIATPTAIVTDLGTEFGVEVDRRGCTTSHVFRGSVKVACLDHAVQQREIALTANQSARVERVSDRSGRLQTVVCRLSEQSGNALAFARVLPRPHSKSEDEAYGRLVLSMHPAVYYRMHPVHGDANSRVLYDSAPGGHHGMIHFPDEYIDPMPFTSGRFGQAMRFRGLLVKDYAAVSDYPKAKDGRLSVSVWVLAMSRQGKPMIAVSRAKPAHVFFGGQFMLYLAEKTGDLCAETTQENGSPAMVREGVNHFPLETWQHVALTIDGRTMRLYRNAIEVASCPCNGIRFDPEKKNLIVGCRWDDTIAYSEVPSYWLGRICELAVFNQALSKEEITALYLGQPSAASNAKSGKTRLP